MDVNKIFVRSFDKTVFGIDPETLNPLTTGYYDPYCFNDPLPGVKYISFDEWCTMRNEQWVKQRAEYYKKKAME